MDNAGPPTHIAGAEYCPQPILVGTYKCLGAIKGPNGSDRNTFAHALAGRDGYEIGGTVTLDGADLLEMEPED